MTDAIDDVGFLTSSPVRARLLQTIDEAGWCATPDLRRQIDASRTTIGRHLDALERHGYVSYDPTRTAYEVTARGTVVAGELSTLMTTMTTVERLRPVLQWLPDGVLDFELDHLAGAEIITGDRHDPYAPVNRHVAVLQETTTFRCLLPWSGLTHLRKLSESITDDRSYELVVSANVADTVRSDDRYEHVLAALIESDSVSLFVSDDEIEYFLGIYDELVHIGVKDDRGFPRALVESESDVVMDWAENSYAEHREAFRPLE
ncbi:winged helix-turn-helix domain-containing protein [Saliphagus sp. LR7]|uniref:helix-turn-helix transcriptional regulator n=1 Tax=Saliphagus sp. LR7 TaxID=2282654 RepID=UPI000DF79DDB|nr:winged helix-turn-helix domain-containing protein [Saliphagus sp. LR7]